MICKNCGTENPEKANFCKRCGKRMDGKIICPLCKTENSEDAIFCYNCGNRVAGNTQHIAEQKPEQVVVSGGTNAAVAHAAPMNWNKGLEIAGGLCALLGVFAVLVCTFLLGIRAEFSGSGYEDAFGNMEQTIWYYFGDVWKELKELREMGGGISSMTDAEFMTYSVYSMEAVFGLLIAIGTMVATLVCSILTAVRFGMKMSGKTEKGCLPFAVAAVLSFICGAALLVTVNAARADGIKTVPNAAGIAGIVCGVTLLVICVALKIAVKGKELATKQSVMQLCFSIAALALICIVLIFATLPMVNFEEGKVSFLAWGIVLADAEGYVDNIGTPYAFSIVAMIFQMAAVTLAVAAIGSRLNNLSSQKPNSGIALSVLLMFASVLFLIFAVLALSISADKLRMEEGFNYAYVIVEFVFAALSLILAIVYKVLISKKKTA